MPRDPTWTEWWHSPAEEIKYENKYDDKQAWWHSSEEKGMETPYNNVTQCYWMPCNSVLLVLCNWFFNYFVWGTEKLKKTSNKTDD